MPSIKQLIQDGLFRPQALISQALRKSGYGSFRFRMTYEAVSRPAYAYCMYQAALMAARLGLSKISVIEFGVAGGNGLLAMESNAAAIEKEVPVEIEIYGFDTGTGLPDPVDYRDLPYVFKKGHYKMDEAKLRGALKRSKLILGDVKHTVPSFFEKYSAAPIAFAAFDLDYYLSTVYALRIFESDHGQILPRVFCYFDDIIGNDTALVSEWVGELLAIKEFNEGHKKRKIAPINGLRHKRIIQSRWNDMVYALHDFDHPDYGIHIDPVDDHQLPLKA